MQLCKPILAGVRTDDRLLVCLGASVGIAFSISTPAPDADLHLADIDAAIEDMHQSVDISREDLDALLSPAELQGQRAGGGFICGAWTSAKFQRQAAARTTTAPSGPLSY